MRGVWGLIALAICLSGATVFSPMREARLSIAAQQSDFALFKAQLRVLHPGLYTYASKAEVDSAFAAIDDSLLQPQTSLELYRLLAPLKSLIKDGHTYFYPADSLRERLAREAPMPFSVFWDGKVLWVRAVKNPDWGLKAGDQILTINGRTSQSILKTLLISTLRDGDNQTYPKWIVNRWFALWYRNHFDVPRSWDLTVKSGNGPPRYLQLPLEDWPSVPGTGTKPKGIHLRYEGEIGILSIPSFNHQILKGNYGQKFRPEIKKAFAQLEANNTQQLILDLRDNQGGHISNGKYLLSYLFEERYDLVLAMMKVANPTVESDETRLKNCFWQARSPVRPQANPFGGELIVLMNGGSFSCTGAV
ncbi:MAG: S41 family peptidase, partial [Bacteroidota bacterium]